MSDRTPSWKDRLHRAPKGAFVGRTVQLQAFRSTLATPLEQRETLLFNISGQGGIGKTTLLKQFRRIAEELKGVAAYVDEGSATNAIDNVPEALSRLALDLERQGYELKEFQKQYRTYRQKKQELEADPEAPTGLAAGMGKFMTKAGIGVAKSLPGGGLLDVVDADGLADQAGAWTAFVARKLGNKDEVQLVQEPVEVLTPLFLAELNRIAAKQTVVLLLDTYEQTGAFWEDWLLAVLEERFAESLPANCVLCIAGRDPLDRNGWVEWEPLLVRSELEPFSRVEAEEFLAGQGVTATAVVEEIWRLSSGGLPVLIGMMAQGAPGSVGAVSDACESAVERFLKWEQDEAQRTLALRAALPRVLNQDVLAVVQGGEDVERLFGWLKGRSFVVQHPEGWQYHAIVREQMLRYQRRLSLAVWERLHGQLAAFYEERRRALGLEEKAQWQDEVWRNYTLEWLYHSLCEAPQKNLCWALNGWLTMVKNVLQDLLVDAPQDQQDQTAMWTLVAQKWAAVMIEVGEIENCKDLKNWGELFDEHEDENAEIKIEERLSDLSKLLNSSHLEDQSIAVVHCYRASVYCQMPNCLDDALIDLKRAIELDSSWVFPHMLLSYVYQMQGRYKESITSYLRVVECTPSIAHYQNLGNLYTKHKYYSEAISTYQKILELPNSFETSENTHALAHNSLGNVYREQKRFDEAIAAYQQAITVDPQCQYAFLNLGRTHRLLERYSEAIQSYNRALEIHANYGWAICERGYAYLLMKQCDRALQDFDRAIALNSQNDWYFYCRAIAHLSLNHPEAANTDIVAAIALAQAKYDEDSTNWKNTCNLALYHLVANEFDKANGLYRSAIAEVPNDFLQEAQRDLQDFLSLFPGHEFAQEMATLLGISD